MRYIRGNFKKTKRKTLLLVMQCVSVKSEAELKRENAFSVLSFS